MRNICSNHSYCPYIDQHVTTFEHYFISAMLLLLLMFMREVYVYFYLIL